MLDDFNGTLSDPSFLGSRGGGRHAHANLPQCFLPAALEEFVVGAHYTYGQPWLFIAARSSPLQKFRKGNGPQRQARAPDLARWDINDHHAIASPIPCLAGHHSNIDFHNTKRWNLLLDSCLDSPLRRFVHLGLWLGLGVDRHARGAAQLHVVDHVGNVAVQANLLEGRMARCNMLLQRLLPSCH